MSALAVPLAVPLVFTLLCWLISLRRTPWARIWLFVCVPTVGFGMLMIAAAEAVHHTLLGLIAAATGSIVLPAVFGVATEVSAGTAEPIGQVRDWRAARPSSRRVHGNRWTVRAVPNEKAVYLYVVRAGAPDRLIGSADPLTDMNAFMELRVKADQAAETLNALKIGS